MLDLLAPRTAAAEATHNTRFRFRRRAEQPRRFESQDVLAVARFVKMIVAGFNFLPDLMSFDAIGSGGLEIIDIQRNIVLAASYAQLQSKPWTFAFPNRVICLFIDAANDFTQQKFFFLVDAFSKHLDLLPLDSPL